MATRTKPLNLVHGPCDIDVKSLRGFRQSKYLPAPLRRMLRPARRVPVLIVGSSHTGAVSAALGLAPDPDYGVVRLSANKLPRTNGRGAGLYAALKPDIVILMIGGNHHHGLGLLEGPEPFDFESDEVPGIDPTRRLVSRQEMRAALTATTEKAVDRILAVRGAYPDLPMAYVCSPPPVSDANHLINHLKTFERKAGPDPKIGPAPVRLKLYHLQIAIFRDFCAEHGLDFIPAPEKAFDAEGFLRNRLRRNDPTHGNTEYGVLALETIKEYVADVRAGRRRVPAKAAPARTGSMESA